MIKQKRKEKAEGAGCLGGGDDDKHDVNNNDNNKTKKGK